MLDHGDIVGIFIKSTPQYFVSPNLSVCFAMAVVKSVYDNKTSYGVCVYVCLSVCLVRVELMDYLDSIDCSLEDFQAMLYGKQFGIDFDALEVN